MLLGECPPDRNSKFSYLYSVNIFAFLRHASVHWFMLLHVPEKSIEDEGRQSKINRVK